jgi:hypothetical protein
VVCLCVCGDFICLISCEWCRICGIVYVLYVSVYMRDMSPVYVRALDIYDNGTTTIKHTTTKNNNIIIKSHLGPGCVVGKDQPAHAATFQCLAIVTNCRRTSSRVPTLDPRQDGEEGLSSTRLVKIGGRLHCMACHAMAAFGSGEMSMPSHGNAIQRGEPTRCSPLAVLLRRLENSWGLLLFSIAALV